MTSFQIERVAGGREESLREIGPMPFDQRDGGEGSRGAVGFGRNVETVEFAVELKAAGGSVGQVIGQHVEGFHAGAQTARGRNG